MQFTVKQHGPPVSRYVNYCDIEQNRYLGMQLQLELCEQYNSCDLELTHLNANFGIIVLYTLNFEKKNSVP